MTGFSSLPVSEAAAGAPIQWLGTSKVSGPRFLKMPILTIGMLGLQIIWSVEMSYASPYLLSLGMSKSLMSIVFLAGPLSGLIVQPLIGILSDRSNSRFGRRRPYILLGTLISFGAMYLLGFTRQFASIVTTKGSTANDALTIGLAVWSIYCIDFSINAAQATDRALLVDILPVSEQERGNAWAGRMFGLGSVFGFFFGNVDLTQSLPFLGHTQLEVLCVVTSCILLATHLITIFHVKERVLVKATDGTHVKFGLFRAVMDIWRNFFALPVTIKRICFIQLFAWIGWFPVLFWTSLYVGELHKRNSPVPQTEDAWVALDSEATRLGSRAMLCNALASFFASIVCPFFVSSDRDNRRGDGARNYEERSAPIERSLELWKRRPTCHIETLWAVSHGAFSVCMLSTFLINNVSAATAVMTLTGFSWAMTQWAPFALIAEAIHTASLDVSSHYVLGSAEDSDDESISIPLRDARTNRRSNEAALPPRDAEETRRIIFEAKEDDNDEDEDDESEHGRAEPSKSVHFEVSDSRASREITSRSTLLGLNSHAQLSQADIHSEDAARGNFFVHEANEEDGVGTLLENRRSIKTTGERSIEDKAGIILGIHNVFIVIPQFIITGLSSIIFAIMDSGKPDLTSHGPLPQPENTSGPIENITAPHDLLPARSILSPRAAGEAGVGSADSVGLIFRIGGVSAAVACVLCLQLARELKRARR